MDRIDAMKVFVAALDEGSLAGAGASSAARRLRSVAPSPSWRCGSAPQLLHRTTRSIKLSEAGERYAVACRRVLTDLEEAEIAAAGERSAPRGALTLTAPVHAGEIVLRPILDAFMEAYPAVSARLYLLDRPVNLIDEGIDVALRIAHLDNSHRSRPGSAKSAGWWLPHRVIWRSIRASRRRPIWPSTRSLP